MVKVFIKTFGCSHNFADSEEMSSYLIQAKYEVEGLDDFRKESDEEIIKKSDIIIYNTCTVKNPSDDKFFSLLKKTKKPVILAGCIPQSQQEEEWLKNYSAIGVDNLDLIDEVVKKTLEGKIIHRLNKKTSFEKRELPLIRRNKFIAIIPILEGCLGACTYCKTKHARGHLKSYPLKIIINQIRKAKNTGAKEVWLVSEDNGAYGKDINSSFPELLNEISKIIINNDESEREEENRTKLKIRVGMLNPEYAFEYRKELGEILKQKQFYKFLHIPIQCADNEVLKEMKRPYTIEECKETFDYLKKEIPEITIATDIICGFPTETEEQFEKTMDFVKEQEFTVINISKFYPRPKTPAAKMKLLPTDKVKRRSKKLSDWFSSINFNKDYEGLTVSALFTEKGKYEGSFIGKTDNYRNVIVKTDKNILGKELLVKIKTTTRDDLRGELLK